MMFKRSLKQLQEGSKLIKTQFGIELKWNELEALSFYPLQYAGRDPMTKTAEAEWLCRFMYDYFGLDLMKIGNWTDPKLKEYCKGHVGVWREERELI